MKKVLLALTILITIIMLSGCFGNAITRQFGGTITIKLESGKKLVNCTWKDNEFWYLVRDKRNDEKPETFEFIEKSNLGVVEGKVIIKEQ